MILNQLLTKPCFSITPKFYHPGTSNREPLTTQRAPVHRLVNSRDFWSTKVRLVPATSKRLVSKPQLAKTCFVQPQFIRSNSGARFEHPSKPPWLPPQFPGFRPTRKPPFLHATGCLTKVSLGLCIKGRLSGYCYRFRGFTHPGNPGCSMQLESSGWLKRVSLGLCIQGSLSGFCPDFLGFTQPGKPWLLLATLETRVGLARVSLGPCKPGKAGGLARTCKRATGQT